MCSHFFARAEIINGFSFKKKSLEDEIKSVVLGLNDPKSEANSKKRKLNILRREYATISKNFEDTQQLIEDFKAIDPLLFKRVSDLRNANGIRTNVYIRHVKLTSKESKYLYDDYNSAEAFTCVRNDKNFRDICISPYGTNTITVIIGKNCNPLIALAHEFGHVLYIVPNLKKYSKILSSLKNKPWYHSGSGSNHNLLDPSHTFVMNIEKQFADHLNMKLSQLSYKFGESLK
jgi:hypothetical protein